MLLDNIEKFRVLIIDHYQFPRNYVNQKIDSTDLISSSISSCSDDFDISIKLDLDKIDKVLFCGSGCVISTSAISILLTKLVGQEMKTAKEILLHFIDVCYGRITSNYMFEEFEAYANIHKKPNRIKCASNGAESILEWMRGLENA
jgi:nitrogen fixation NifU-like protein